MKQAILLLTALFLALFVSRLAQDGMFVDGVIYSSIANNLAHGLGSFWALHFTNNLDPVFYGHPPLMMGIESLFFRIFGEGFLTERIYCGVVALLTMYLLVQIWKAAFGESLLRNWWPAPLFFWMLNEDIFLSYTGNMLECTMAVFDLVAVLFLLKKWPLNTVQSASKPTALYFALAAAAVVAAFLTKGLTGLFPLAFFGVHWFATGRKNGLIAIKNTAIFTVLTLAMLGVFFIYPASREMLSKYLNLQVFAALKGELTDNIAPYRLYMLQRFAETHLHWIILGAILWYYTAKKKARAIAPEARQVFLFFLLMGAAALLPIMLSPKQAPHYIVPAVSWFALAAGTWSAGWLQQWQFRPAPRWLTVALILPVLAAAIFAGARAGMILPRSQQQLGQVRTILRILPPNATLGCIDDNMPFIMHAYFQRYNFTTLTENFVEHKYVIVRKGMAIPDDLPRYSSDSGLRMADYMLYIKR